MPVSSAPLDLRTAVHTDGGPIYTETRLDRPIAEPFNAASALLFLGIALYWAPKMKRYRPGGIPVLCLVLLAVGGVGGTLFHALRNSKIFLMMDVVPIGAIGVLIALHFWRQVGAPALIIAAACLPSIGAALLLDRWSAHSAANAAYLLLAGLIIVPILLNVHRTAYAGARVVFRSIAWFAAALVFRMIDVDASSWNPTGTHWLWHVCAAAAAHGLTDYVLRSEKRERDTEAQRRAAAA